MASERTLANDLHSRIGEFNTRGMARVVRLLTVQVHGPHYPRCRKCGLRIRRPGHEAGDSHKARAKG